MDFKQATDGLFARVDHAQLAENLAVSVASIRQARLRPGASAHRPPPPDWEPAVVRLAEQRVDHLRALIQQVRMGRVRALIQLLKRSIDSQTD